MKVYLEDEDKLALIKLIGPVLSGAVDSLLLRSNLENNDANRDAVEDVVCNFLGEYYGGCDCE